MQTWKLLSSHVERTSNNVDLKLRGKMIMLYICSQWSQDSIFSYNWHSNLHMRIWIVKFKLNHTISSSVTFWRDDRLGKTALLSNPMNRDQGFMMGQVSGVACHLPDEVRWQMKAYLVFSPGKWLAWHIVGLQFGCPASAPKRWTAPSVADCLASVRRWMTAKPTRITEEVEFHCRITKHSSHYRKKKIRDAHAIRSHLRSQGQNS